MNPKEFSQVGDLMQSLSGPYPEGRARSAVSRYYYSAFLQARDMLRTKRGWLFKTHKVHDAVRRCFAHSDDRELMLVGRLLEDLKKLRESADYDLDNVQNQDSGTEARRIQDDIEAALAKIDFNKCPQPERDALARR